MILYDIILILFQWQIYNFLFIQQLFSKKNNFMDIELLKLLKSCH